MRVNVFILVAFSIVTLISCNNRAEETQLSGEQKEVEALFLPSSTLQELMISVIDGNVDPIWNAISTETGATGIVEVRPHTDADWLQLRNYAINLREAANLLVIEGRRVAHPEANTSSHHSELKADEIEVLTKKNWTDFVAHAHSLHSAANLAVIAIDAKDVGKLEEVGGAIEHVCEACHSQFWYPGDKRPAQ